MALNHLVALFFLLLSLLLQLFSQCLDNLNFRPLTDKLKSFLLYLSRLDPHSLSAKPGSFFLFFLSSIALHKELRFHLPFPLSFVCLRLGLVCLGIKYVYGKLVPSNLVPHVLFPLTWSHLFSRRL